ncbi:MAG: NAD-dependent epimerase/dehydratase family protein [bacterium]|nr:NAD-dependent epimerase/dehydratase family protein [bacterium]
MTGSAPQHWKGRTVLVTGATGFLGGWLVKELYARGASIVALIRDHAPRSMLVSEGWLERISAVNGSLGDLALLRRMICEYEIDTIFHLGAQTLVGVGKKDPVGTLECNVQGTWNVLDAARQAGIVKRIVVASSDKAYGTSHELPYRETYALQGEFPYDVSKSCTDLICRMYALTYQLPVAVTRCGNLFGGGDLNFSRTVPGLILATLQDERFLIRSDGKFVRDFLYARDAVEAYLCLAERMSEDGSLAGEAFNFSLEIRLTVLDVVEKVLEMMGRQDLDPIIQNIASNEVREQYMVAGKARERLDWVPKYGLEKGLEETIAWYKDYHRRQAGTRNQARNDKS